MPRVLITGAAGFIGMHTCIRFLNEGWNVIGLDNMNPYYSINLKRKRVAEIAKMAANLHEVFEFLECDLNSLLHNLDETTEIDAVVHLAAQAGVRFSIENPREYLTSNILGFQTIIELVQARNISRFVYASSSSVYGKTAAAPFKETEACDSPESYYAATKRSNELMAHSYFKTSGLKSIGLRFFTVYGPWGRPDMAPYIFAEAALENREIKVFNYGNQKRDFTYIDDIVEGIYLSIRFFERISSAEIFNIGYGSPTNLFSFIKEIESSTNKELKLKLCPAQEGDVELTYASTEKFSRIFGYKPVTGLREGVDHFVKWLKFYRTQR